MIGQTYSVVQLRYATEELAKHKFVKEADYLLSRKFGRNMMGKVMEMSLRSCDNIDLEEEIEELKAARNYWHHMYNQATAPDNTPLDFSLVEDVVPV